LLAQHASAGYALRLRPKVCIFACLFV
jgi:hypothetical protein